MPGRIFCKKPYSTGDCGCDASSSNRYTVSPLHNNMLKIIRLVLLFCLSCLFTVVSLCNIGSLKDRKRWNAEEEHPTEVRELGKSKWSEDFGEDDIDQTEGMKGNINALSGLIHQYGKERKSVHWGDQVGKTGFSIGTARKVTALSLVIGSGAGYNLKSNPLPEEESPSRNSVEPTKNITFQERIRAERESFKAVFDGRRPRIGLDIEED